LRPQWKNFARSLSRLDENKETGGFGPFAAGYPPDLLYGY
jgi:hypothetical protein